jgi:ADP-ribose pyrophosphatase
MGDDVHQRHVLSRDELWRGSIGSFGIDDTVLPNGARRRMAVLRHPGAAAVLAFLDRDTVLLLRQYRHAVGTTLWEVPAGKLDPGEDPVDCAARELREETGYAAARVEPMGRIHTAPGFTDEVIHLFAAHGLTAGDTRLEAGEIIETVALKFEQALTMIDRNEITDGKTVCALTHALRRRASG